MRVVGICQDELVIRTLDDVLKSTFELDFLVESRPLARRLHEAGINVTVGDPRRVDTYLKADISPTTCFIVEDNGRRSPRKILSAIRDAGGLAIVQDKESSVINGMPQAARALAGADRVEPLGRVARSIVELLGEMRTPAARPT